MLKISKSPTRELVGGRSNRFATAMRKIRKFIILLIVLLLLGISGGGFYIWYTGKDAKSVQQKPTQKVAVAKEEKAKRSSVGVVGVHVQFITDVVDKGGGVSMSIHTNSKAACDINVTYSIDGSKQEATDSGLIEKEADDRGFTSWDWIVDPSVPAGNAEAMVTCRNEKNSGVVIGNFKVR